MHNSAAKNVKIIDKCKNFVENLVNEQGNMPQGGIILCFSDLEVLVLSIISECQNISSEHLQEVDRKIAPLLIKFTRLLIHRLSGLKMR